MSYVDQGNQCRGHVTLTLKRNESAGYFDVSGTTSDADGTAFITEGSVTYEGDAWWVDEVRSGNDTGLKVLTTGKFDWSTNSFQGAWRANTGQSGRYSSFESTNVMKGWNLSVSPSIDVAPIASAPPAETEEPELYVPSYR